MKLKTIALPALCTGLYKFPTSLAVQLLFEEILHYNHHDLNQTITEFILIDINEKRAKMMAREFDNRDFE
jgi:O-acetyl-ADP-ribose deacetylase (regulator of RNase III)